MDFLTILAQAAETAVQTAPAEETGVVPVDLIAEQIMSLGLLEALTFMAFGTVCILYGWRVFKALVVISFALIGAGFGMLVSTKIAGDHNPLIAILMAIVLAIVSIPLMRWAVSILGAVAGGVLAAGIWFACELPQQYIWTGALVGVVAGGMISFIVFRIAVMLFTSLGGSAVMVTGLLALLHLYSLTTESVDNLIYNCNWFLPAALLVPTAVGVFLQNRLVKGSPNWSV